MKLRLAAALLRPRRAVEPARTGYPDQRSTRRWSRISTATAGAEALGAVPRHGDTRKRTALAGRCSISRFPGGLAARAQPTAMQDQTAHTSCTGPARVAIFDPPEGKTPAEVATIVNTFNASPRCDPGRSTTRTATTRLTYYIIADFGITKTNLDGPDLQLPADRTGLEPDAVPRSRPRGAYYGRGALSRGIPRSRRSFLLILPVAPWGSSSTNSTASGSHHLATLVLRKRRMSSASTSWPGLRTTTQQRPLVPLGMGIADRGRLGHARDGRPRRFRARPS